MKNECSIVRDLLPLYAEQLTSQETNHFIEEHLLSCEDCRRIQETLCSDPPVTPVETSVPLGRIMHSLRRRQLNMALMAASLVALVFITVFAALTAPEYLPYSEGLLTVSPRGETEVLVSLPRYVADYTIDTIDDPATGERMHALQIWTSAWSRMFPGSTNVISIPVGRLNTPIYYVQGNGEEDVCIWGNAPASGGMITLPRLVLGYYLLIASAALLIVGIIWLLTRVRFPAAARWLCRLLPLPGCYIAAHMLICGFRTVSYAVTRDFLLIVCTALLLYCVAILLAALFRQRKEVRKISEL